MTPEKLAEIRARSDLYGRLLLEGRAHPDLVVIGYQRQRDVVALLDALEAARPWSREEVATALRVLDKGAAPALGPAAEDHRAYWRGTADRFLEALGALRATDRTPQP